MYSWIFSNRFVLVFAIDVVTTQSEIFLHQADINVHGVRLPSQPWNKRTNRLGKLFIEQQKPSFRSLKAVPCLPLECYKTFLGI